MLVNWIDKQIERRGINRRELAEHIGLTESQMSKVMNGTRRLTADEADAIRRFFGYRLPDDPADDDLSRIHEALTMLGDRQRRAVVLYLEALVDSEPGRKKAI